MIAIKPSWVIIGVLLVALAGAGFLLKSQIEENAYLNTELKTQKVAHELLEKSYKESKDKIESLLEDDRVSSEKIDKIKKKAAEDQARVRKIAEKKAALYEKLVNRDFKETQKELRRISE